ncbi:uncharacterized protein [Lolium perenne]|uniref:uncharacterized protein isoform X2 n=1 Tax=Lolium perenne TaxID=4522 RepID=UPI0021F5DCA1|nr:uncharacterized protein LOC127321595 isoform X2 [Lolium perenne]
MNYEVALPREITTGKCFLQHYIVYSGFTRGHLQTGGGSRGVTLPTSVLILKGKIAGAQGCKRYTHKMVSFPHIMYLHAPAPPPAALVVDALGQPRPQHLAARQDHRRTSLVDTLALVRKLESLGVLTKHAEAITTASRASPSPSSPTPRCRSVGCCRMPTAPSSSRKCRAHRALLSR